MAENPLDVAAVRAGVERLAHLESQERDTQQQIAEGISAIRDAMEQARADIVVVDNLRTQAAALSTQITNRIAAVSAFTPAATYSPAQLAAVRDEIVWCLTQLRTLTDAQNGMYGWRRAVDENAVLTDASLLGLAWLSQKEGGS
jgi:hypothetical protein